MKRWHARKKRQDNTAMYRGHGYSIKSRGRYPHVWYACCVDGEIMTKWHRDPSSAGREFRAGVDDILDDGEPSGSPLDPINPVA